MHAWGMARQLCHELSDLLLQECFVASQLRRRDPQVLHLTGEKSIALFEQSDLLLGTAL